MARDRPHIRRTHASSATRTPESRSFFCLSHVRGHGVGVRVVVAASSPRLPILPCNLTVLLMRTLAALRRSNRSALAGFSLPPPNKNIPPWKHPAKQPEASELADRQAALDTGAQASAGRQAPFVECHFFRHRPSVAHRQDGAVFATMAFPRTPLALAQSAGV